MWRRGLLCLLLCGCSLVVPTDHLSSDPDGGGRGQPTTIASGPGEPRGLTLGDRHVFWVTRKYPALMRASKEDPRPERLDGPDDRLVDPFDVATDGALVYWSDAGTVYKKPVSGGPRQAILPAPASHLAFDRELFLLAGDRVMSASNSIVHADMPPLSGLAAHARALYWLRASSGQLVRAPATSGTVQALRMLPGAGGGVAVDDEHVYWIAEGRRLQRAPWALGATAPVVLHEAAQPFGTGDVAVDETHVYWTEPATGLVRRLAK